MRSSRNAVTRWKTKPISPKPPEQRGAGGEAFALQQQQQQMTGELGACRGAEPAPCEPEGPQRQEPAPCQAFTCLPPRTAKTSAGRQIKGCITVKNSTPGALCFPFPPRHIPARVRSVYKFEGSGIVWVGFFFFPPFALVLIQWQRFNTRAGS